MSSGQDQYCLGKSGLIMNFNDQTVICDTDTIPIMDRDKALYHHQKPWLRFTWEKMTERTKTLRERYSRSWWWLDSDLLQNIMSNLIQDMEYVNTKTYLDSLSILTEIIWISFKAHLFTLEMVLARLSTTGIRVNVSRSKFFTEQIEYLMIWYWIIRKGI
jgi:hypothetical protein